jgi:hypothetical protein
MTTITEDITDHDLMALAIITLQDAQRVPLVNVRRAAAGGLTDCYESTVDHLGFDPLAAS